MLSKYYPARGYTGQVSDVADYLAELLPISQRLRVKKISRFKANFVRVVPVSAREAKGVLSVVIDNIKNCADILADLRDNMAPSEDIERLDNAVVRLNEIYLGLKEIG